MPAVSQYFGAIVGVRPTAKVSGNLIQAVTGAPYMPIYGVEKVASGACTANTLKTVLSVSGRSALTWLAAESLNTTSRTARLRITIDGAVVYDKTSASGNLDSRAILAHGGIADGQAGTMQARPIEGVALVAESSLLIEYASSLTETNMANIGYIYYTR